MNQILSRFAALSQQNPERQTLIAAERDGLLEDPGGLFKGCLIGAELAERFACAGRHYWFAVPETADAEQRAEIMKRGTAAAGIPLGSPEWEKAPVVLLIAAAVPR